MPAAALGAFEPRLYSQQHDRLAGAVCRKLVEREHGLVITAASQAPRRDAIHPVAPVVGEIGE